MIVFPMAGQSTRFRAAGYVDHKFMLPLGSRSLFEWVIEPFIIGAKAERFVFVLLDGSVAPYVRSHCMKMDISDYDIVILGRPTSGQASTVYEALKQVDFESTERLYIYNIDTIRKEFSLDMPAGVAGALDLFVGEGDHWSFAELDSDSRVLRTAEKNRISKYCSDGMYYFGSPDIFIDVYEKSKSFITGERYIAPLYNIVIEEGLAVHGRVIDIRSLRFCGIPSEYETLQHEIDDMGKIAW